MVFKSLALRRKVDALCREMLLELVPSRTDKALYSVIDVSTWTVIISKKRLADIEAELTKRYNNGEVLE